MEPSRDTVLRRHSDEPSRRGLLYALTGTVAATAFAAVSLLLGAAPAHAEGHVYDIANKTYKSECSACHVAFPPQLLSAQSWRAIMAGLDKHFGTDASVDPKAAEELRRYLESNASQREVRVAGSASSTAPRITESGWFLREHRKVPDHIWRSKAVGSATNCVACHTRADQGDYAERSLRVPR